MNKQSLIDHVSKETGVSLNDVRVVVNSVFDAIKSALLKNDDVRINEFGRFYNKFCASKLARNLTNNTAMKIPAYYKPILEVSKQLKSSVKNEVKVEANDKKKNK